MKLLAYPLIAILFIPFLGRSFPCQTAGIGSFNEFTEEEEVHHSDLAIIGSVIEVNEVMDLNPQGTQRPDTTIGIGIV
ncbi:hypothetical protein [Xanthomonas floridensis]|uniref:Uncharacterized protein n=1 Tax=Xanthomonas floridensis TaxID=1843580 RepID=A0ABU5PW64_9XANT|nr:hypothetical protein [Xanthomonas floridensis]MEA5123821.1 hypothetical protein [Xanthomonas floridensis]MEA5131500.1 hypothetical protein [Xanthomonas floridensis]